MIWQNPWAWLGLFTLLVPLLIHLLSRHRARVLPFPSLRFLPVSRLQPARSTRISDPLLLLVRLAILTAAVLALAQPLFLTGQRRRDLERTIVRAVLVDTSRSMQRASTTGEPALTVARRDAQRLAAEAGSSVILESATLAQALPGAVAWLNTQPGRRELIALSDYQLGALEASDLRPVPADIGVQFQQLTAAVQSTPLEMTTRNADAETTARIALAAEGTTVEWLTRPVDSQQRAAWRSLAGATEQTAAGAAEQAAWSVAGKPALNDAHTVAIVQPQYGRRTELLRSAKAIDQQWMSDVVLRVQRDSTFATAAAVADVTTDSVSAPLIVLARNESQQPVALAARAQLDGSDALLLFSQGEAGSLASAALLAAVSRALSVPTSASELEPDHIPAAVLQSWQRPAQPATRPNSGARARERNTGASDGRWFWLLALLLLAVESWLRRTRVETAINSAVQERHERVA